ncbi:MAG TPA: hypothetical protein VIH72_07415 [Candidatus Acidoferrales bacterium]
MKRTELFRGIKNQAYLLCFSFLCFFSPAVHSALVSHSTLEPRNVSVANLIDDLVDIDAEAPGLHSTALVRTFIGDNSPSEFGGGVIGSVAPQNFPQMTELVRRGVSSLPLLIKHLADARPTKLTVGGDFFMFRYFSDEYDSKALAPREESARLEKTFDGKYTVRVGDVCYALIGQIVNRNLLPVRYQPTAGLVVNSPIEAPILIEEVKRDWADVDAKEHMASLLADARAGNDLWEYEPALRRLRFYYPDEYRKQALGALKEKIRRFESGEKKQK